MQKIYQYAVNREMSLSAIKVPKSFLATTPDPNKVAFAKAFYETHGFLDQPIIINHKGVLFDGYIRYLIALEHNLEPVSVIQVNAKIKGDVTRVPVTIHLSLKERLCGRTTVML